MNSFRVTDFPKISLGSRKILSCRYQRCLLNNFDLLECAPLFPIDHHFKDDKMEDPVDIVFSMV